MRGIPIALVLGIGGFARSCPDASSDSPETHRMSFEFSLECLSLLLRLFLSGYIMSTGFAD